MYLQNILKREVDSILLKLNKMMTKKKINAHYLLIIPLFIFLQTTFPFFAEKGIPKTLNFAFGITLTPNENTLLFNTASLLSQVIVIITFIIMYKGKIFYDGLKRIVEAKKYFIHIILLYSLVLAFAYFYNKLLLSIGEFHLINLLSTIITIGILTPIVEELIYRYLLISELGKIFGYRLMAVISILIFALSHFLHFNSFISLLPFLIGGISLVGIFMYSKRNIAVSIILHILINLGSQIQNLLGF